MMKMNNIEISGNSHNIIGIFRWSFTHSSSNKERDAHKTRRREKIRQQFLDVEM